MKLSKLLYLLPLILLGCSSDDQMKTVTVTGYSDYFYNPSAYSNGSVPYVVGFVNQNPVQFNQDTNISYDIATGTSKTAGDTTYYLYSYINYQGLNFRISTPEIDETQPETVEQTFSKGTKTMGPEGQSFSLTIEKQGKIFRTKNNIGSFEVIKYKPYVSAYGGFAWFKINTLLYSDDNETCHFNGFIYKQFYYHHN